MTILRAKAFLAGGMLVLGFICMAVARADGEDPGEPDPAASAQSRSMSECINHSIGPAEQSVLNRWLFVSMARHPDLQGLSNVSAAQHDEINAAAAKFLQTLLTQTCRAPILAAMRHDGPKALHTALQTLGKAVGKELLANPKVGAGLLDTLEYVNLGELLHMRREATSDR